MAKNGNKEAQLTIYRSLLEKGLVRKFHQKYGYFNNKIKKT